MYGIRDSISQSKTLPIQEHYCTLHWYVTAINIRGFPVRLGVKAIFWRNAIYKRWYTISPNHSLPRKWENGLHKLPWWWRNSVWFNWIHCPCPQSRYSTGISLLPRSLPFLRGICGKKHEWQQWTAASLRWHNRTICYASPQWQCHEDLWKHCFSDVQPNEEQFAWKHQIGIVKGFLASKADVRRDWCLWHPTLSR